jgi:hypothetical protein
LLRTSERTIRAVLAHLHQELKLALFDLLFKDTKASLLPDVECLIDGLACLLDLADSPALDFSQHAQAIADVVVGTLAGCAWIRHAVQILEQPKPFDFVATARLLQCPELRQELRELRIVETEEFLALNYGVPVQQALYLARWKVLCRLSLTILSGRLLPLCERRRHGRETRDEQPDKDRKTRDSAHRLLVFCNSSCSNSIT